MSTNLPALTLAKRPLLGQLTPAQEKPTPKNAPRNIPAFLTKLYTMVNDPTTDHLIRWNEPSADSFFVVSSERFGRELLPKYFKHSNFGSFVRQLNMYGFHKVPHLNQGVLQGEVPETEMLEFTNPHFQRGQPDLLCLIQRKKTATDSNTTPTTTALQPDPADPSAPHSASSHPPLELASVMSEVAAIRKHQALLSADLKNLQSSNAHLWQEAIASRDRNKRCQETITKILGFLAQVFGGRVLGGHSQSNSSMAAGVERDGKMDSSDDASEIRHPSGANATPPPLYNFPRLPRLLLEDVQRGEPAGSSHRPQGKQADERSRRTASPKDSNNLFARSFASLIASPRKTVPGTPPSRFHSVLDSPSETVIDPNLVAGAAPATNQPESPPTTDAYSPDAVVQALFSENNSNGTFGSNGEGLFSSLNWVELLSNNDPTAVEPLPPNLLQGSSPLRITNCVLPSAGSVENHAGAIEAIDDKVESLEAAIERLVGTLPKTIDPEYQPRDLGNEANHVTDHRTALEGGGGGFDQEAFIKYFLSSENKSALSPLQQSASSPVQTSKPATPPERYEALPPVSSIFEPTLAPSSSIPFSEKQQQHPVSNPIEREPTKTSGPQELDFDRILDEWTGDEKAHALAPQDVIMGSGEEPFVFDFDDVSQLRRLMAKKAGGTNGKRAAAPVVVDDDDIDCDALDSGGGGDRQGRTKKVRV